MDDLSRFGQLPLESMIITYNSFSKKAGSPIDNNYELYAERIYERFFSTLNEAIRNKFQFVFEEMNLETIWFFRFEKDLTSKNASIALIYDMDDCGKSDYEPLVEFFFTLNQGKLNNAYLTVVFERISEILEERLSETFDCWSLAMAKYYQSLIGHFQECLKGEDFSSPMDNPEQFFLTHTKIVLY